MNNSKYYLCRRGVPHSAMRLDSAPSEADMQVLSKMGFELAKPGKRYRKSVVCPVNGDGYWYTRCTLLDSDGEVVGTFEVDDGPRGEV